MKLIMHLEIEGWEQDGKKFAISTYDYNGDYRSIRRQLEKMCRCMANTVSKKYMDISLKRMGLHE